MSLSYDRSELSAFMLQCILVTISQKFHDTICLCKEVVSCREDINLLLSFYSVLLINSTKFNIYCVSLTKWSFCELTFKYIPIYISAYLYLMFVYKLLIAMRWFISFLFTKLHSGTDVPEYLFCPSLLITLNAWSL